MANFPLLSPNVTFSNKHKQNSWEQMFSCFTFLMKVENSTETTEAEDLTRPETKRSHTVSV